MENAAYENIFHDFEVLLVVSFALDVRPMMEMPSRVFNSCTIVSAKID